MPGILPAKLQEASGRPGSFPQNCRKLPDARDPSRKNAGSILNAWILPAKLQQKSRMLRILPTKMQETS